MYPNLGTLLAPQGWSHLNHDGRPAPTQIPNSTSCIHGDQQSEEHNLIWKLFVTLPPS